MEREGSGERRGSGEWREEGDGKWREEGKWRVERGGEVESGGRREMGSGEVEVEWDDEGRGRREDTTVPTPVQPRPTDTPEKWSSTVFQTLHLVPNAFTNVCVQLISLKCGTLVFHKADRFPSPNST